MNILVAGAGGFIGGHLVSRLISEGHQVRAVDKKALGDWYQIHSKAENLVLDLSLKSEAYQSTKNVEWVFNLAADMGGMGFIEANKALCMLSSLINTHLLMGSVENKVKRYFFSSSACVYASWHQQTSVDIALKEDDAYPADPEDGYGWEKLFGERMCRHFSEDFGLEVRIARYHNVYGPHGTYDGGREKAPAAACRKVHELATGAANKIQIWGDGNQVRSFTYITDCIDGTLKLMNSEYSMPLNIGSAESITIQQLYDIALKAADVSQAEFEYDFTAPQGVRGRSSENTLCKETLGWAPSVTIDEGIRLTYAWISQELDSLNNLKI
jgi:nucleoside-diphosphate-sugar epimerase